MLRFVCLLRRLQGKSVCIQELFFSYELTDNSHCIENNYINYIDCKAVNEDSDPD